MTGRVLNIRTATHEETVGAVPIWRGTKWGNTHVMKGTVSRREAVERYAAWIKTQPDLMAAAQVELAGKDVLCYCAPRQCHGDVLVRLARGEEI